MCPLCIVVAAQIVVGTTSTGGLAALVVKLRPRAEKQKQKMTKKRTTQEEVSWPSAETRPDRGVDEATST